MVLLVLIWLDVWSIYGSDFLEFFSSFRIFLIFEFQAALNQFSMRQCLSSCEGHYKLFSTKLTVSEAHHNSRPTSSKLANSFSATAKKDKRPEEISFGAYSSKTEMLYNKQSPKFSLTYKTNKPAYIPRKPHM